MNNTTYSHDVLQAHWWDPFELNCSDGDGWMLLDLPGAPCDVMQPAMRTMSQRLRKAQECAAAGGKYGLLQAVLLSLDSQPPGPVQWVREAVALEACSRVLLPEAHQVPLDLDAARAAYQQLTSVEQRLWRHLQAARIQLFHDSRREPPPRIVGYVPDECYIANVLGGVTDDVTALGYEVIRMLLYECRWDLVIFLSKRYGLVGNPATPASMQAAYNWALACYHHHGRDHSETKAALAATEKADPHAYVLKLLSGRTYPMLSLASRHVRGNKMEAAEYAYHYGDLWQTSSSSLSDRVHEQSSQELGASTFSAPLKWLLAFRGLPTMTQQEQRDLAALRLLVCGNPVSAYVAAGGRYADTRELLQDATWPASQERLEQFGIARLLRGLVVEAASLASLTINLPSLAAAQQLWERIGEDIGTMSFITMAHELQHSAQVLVPWISTLIQAYAPRGPPGPASAASAARLGFLDADEVVEIMQVAPYLSIAAARWMWQCGDAAAAQEQCRLEPGGGALYLLQRGVVVDNAMGRMLSSRGLLPSSTAPLEALAAFVAQQSAAQQPGAGLHKVTNAWRVARQLGEQAGVDLITKLADPQEKLLYSEFEFLLDQLLEQVTGRDVMLDVEPVWVDSPFNKVCAGCRVRLEDEDGQQQLFYWDQPGDADGTTAHEFLVQQAKDRGCTDPDLQRYCPAVEPYAAGADAGSRGSRHSSSSSSSSTSRSGRQQQQQGSTNTPRVNAAAAAAATTRRVVQRTTAEQQPGPEGRQPTAATATARPTSGDRKAAVDSGAGAAAGEGGGGGSSSRVKPSRPCAQCGELFPKLKQCSRCKAVAYCSRDCQLAHWKAGHKQACQEQTAG